MSDFSITLVPERIFIEPEEQATMEGRIIAWMQQKGWIETEKSDCVLDKECGWRFTSSGSLHIADEEYKELSIYGFTVKRYNDDKGVFTNHEGGLEAAVCPACGKNIEEQFYGMVGDYMTGNGNALMIFGCMRDWKVTCSP